MKGMTILTSKTTIDKLEEYLVKSFDGELGVKVIRAAFTDKKTTIAFHNIICYVIKIKKQNGDSTEVKISPGLTTNGMLLLFGLFFAGFIPGIIFYFYSEYMQELKGKDVVKIVSSNKELVEKSTMDKHGKIIRGMTDDDLLIHAKNLELSGRYEDAALSYESLNMFDKAKQCRELIQGNTVNIGHLGDISLVDSVMVSDGREKFTQSEINNKFPPFSHTGTIDESGYEVCEFPITSGNWFWKNHKTNSWERWS
jgi:hypothetical protein